MIAVFENVILILPVYTKEAFSVDQHRHRMLTRSALLTKAI